RADVLARPGVPHVVRFRISTADRGWRHLEEVATNLLDDPTVGGVVVNTRDITERRRHEHELLAQARRDPLTGLPNRRLFHELLDSALERAREAHTDVGVVFIDLDRFKLVNDSLGHHVGDALLVEAAARLRDSVRSGDVVARLGGDEFVVMCEGLDAVDELAARVLAAFRLPFRIGAGEVYTTASVGVALARPDADRTELLRDADAAMYAAKARGRNRSAVFDGGLVEAARERLAIESGLRRALEHRELELHWQPIVADGRAPVGVEALLRWHHPERGLLAPESFLDVAEDTGLIIGIGGWAVREACERWAAITRAGEVPPLDLHVNLSVRQLVAPGTAELVAQVLRDTGLDPARLRFEITESALLAGHDAHVELGLIRALGVRLSLDDFGTGYSSLTRLRELDIDMIKIDRSFVAGVDDDPDDVAIVAAIVELARVMRLDVVAEGVETPRQAEALLALGCHRTQGFLHAPPLPLDAVRSWIAGRSGSVEPVPH
ncbi:MAG TPA: EAL domain-containing protein, partial [Acidimicrobiales bacterium]|nr:EAL domain-containing protein [Acidimicrobiales bacterium]